jgi:hypothetical protein
MIGSKWVASDGVIQIFFDTKLTPLPESNLLLDILFVAGSVFLSSFSCSYVSHITRHFSLDLTRATSSSFLLASSEGLMGIHS